MSETALEKPDTRRHPVEHIFPCTPLRREKPDGSLVAQEEKTIKNTVTFVENVVNVQVYNASA